MAHLAQHVPAWLRDFARPLRPVVRAAHLWSEADGLRMSAAMSFYGILSLAPLLILMVAVFGWWLDRDVLEQGLVSQIGLVVGQQGGALVKQALASAKEPADGILASLLGFGVLLFGATGVFTELQEAFERLWRHGRAAPPKEKWWHGASLRLRGVGYILAFGFMLLVSLVVSTMLNLFSGWAGNWMGFETVLRVLNEAVAFAISAALFLALMRISAGPKPAVKLLIVGAVAGAILFTIGRQVLTLYLSTAAVVSAYGAAGSLIVLLMWIYFSAGVLLFSAGFARALEEERAQRVTPAAASAAVPARAQ